MLPVWAPFIIVDGLQFVLVYTLRSLGDQVVAGINSIIAYFLVTGGLGWALVHHGAGPMGPVYASGAGMLVAALLNGSRFWRPRRRFHRPSRARASSTLRARRACPRLIRSCRGARPCHAGGWRGGSWSRAPGRP